ncbi:MAG: YHS domain-containing protein [Gammaproteobacteria bacterium]|nr:MAG: YHS domain-containing protein [Gammaproteobacteria bacterium]UTW41836.1 YHS domain-containing protein [bacterium SCSIO 12844]
MKITCRIYSLLLLLILITGCTTLDQRTYSDDQGAIGGYDPVSYFTMHKAIKGKKDIVYNYHGATWHFSSEDNKTLFIRNPTMYLPQYGGYCAYAMHYGFIVSSDPQAWSIINDKLYLNYSKSVREKWLKHSKEYIQSADKEWVEKIENY